MNKFSAAAELIDVADVAAWLQRPQPPLLLDVRDPDEYAAGCLAGAVLSPLPQLASRIATLIPDPDSPIVIYCASGPRSITALRSLAEMGYTQLRAIRGGFTEWQRAGYAWAAPGGDAASGLLEPEQMVRYARHLRLPEVGLAGQQKLLDARVLCVGAGGLGSPASIYLAAAGVGRIGLVDDDVVELSNLQRQILHTGDRVGMPKVASAELALGALNPDARVTKIQARLTEDNVLAVFADYDVIVDGSDNFVTRYLVNDAALRLAKPVVHAAVQRYEGQLTVFSAAGAPCYRCLFPNPPPADAAPSCAEAGVLGVLPGVLGVLQATEVLKLILGVGESLFGRLVTYDALAMRFRELSYKSDPQCPSCAEAPPAHDGAPG